MDDPKKSNLTKSEYINAVRLKAKEREQSKWLAQAGSVMIGSSASLLAATTTGVYAGFYSGLLTGCIGLLLTFIWRTFWFLVDGAHALHCEQTEKISVIAAERDNAMATIKSTEQRANEAQPSSLEVSEAIHELIVVAKSAGTDAMKCSEWINIADRFVSAVLTPKFERDFLERGQINKHSGPAIIVGQKISFLSHYEHRLTEIDIRPTCTRNVFDALVADLGIAHAVQAVSKT